MKYIVLIMDGAAGEPLEQLEGKTTLEASMTTLLDMMARKGTVGMVRTVPEGLEPSSATAITSILGYDPAQNNFGRGAIEAASMGIELAPNEVALRVNTLSIVDGIMASYSCDAIPTEESTAIVTRLAESLNDDTFTLYPGVSYRHILVVKDHPELMELSFTPPHDISDRAVAPYLPTGPGAELLQDYTDRARALLAADWTNADRIERGLKPATDLWPFWPGVAPQGTVPFAQARGGLTCALTSGVDLLGGLAELFGIDRLEIPEVTGGPDNNFGAQVTGGLDALADHDVVVVHVEAPDEQGHAGDIEGKMTAIEMIDTQMVSRIYGYAKEHGDVRVLVMPDHPTPISIKTHNGSPVPFLLWGEGIDPNGAAAYSEHQGSATGLVVDPGHLVMDLLLGTLTPADLTPPVGE